jgi:hypothetical protein
MKRCKLFARVRACAGDTYHRPRSSGDYYCYYYYYYYYETYNVTSVVAYTHPLH